MSRTDQAAERVSPVVDDPSAQGDLEGPGEPDEWSLKTITDRSERRSPEALVHRVAADARHEPEAFLEQARVEDGGE